MVEAELKRTGQETTRLEPRTVHVGIQSGSVMAEKKIMEEALRRGV